MNECRNCGSGNVKDLGFIGEIAPFFLKRVLNLEVKKSIARHPLKKFARRLFALPNKFFSAAFGSGVFAELQICLSCSFVQTKHAFNDEAIGRLYADYRSASYNRERIHYEPTYAALAAHVGSAEQEVKTRVGDLTAWLSSKIKIQDGFTMLDFGGADGKFLPKIEGKKYVFEISDVSPSDGVIKLTKETELGLYSYVQLAHILEHVTHPLQLVKHVSGFVAAAGYLYIEVPQELTTDQLAGMKAGSFLGGLPIHEHINVYSSESVTKLVEAAGLELISIRAESVDLGWAKSTNIRALCRKS